VTAGCPSNLETRLWPASWGRMVLSSSVELIRYWIFSVPKWSSLVPFLQFPLLSSPQFLMVLSQNFVDYRKQGYRDCNMDNKYRRQNKEDFFLWFLLWFYSV
jgi:hypothetical protein